MSILTILIIAILEIFLSIHINTTMPQKQTNNVRYCMKLQGGGGGSIYLLFKKSIYPFFLQDMHTPNLCVSVLVFDYFPISSLNSCAHRKRQFLKYIRDIRRSNFACRALIPFPLPPLFFLKQGGVFSYSYFTLGQVKLNNQTTG